MKISFRKERVITRPDNEERNNENSFRYTGRAENIKNYMALRNQYPPLSREQELDLILRMKQGDSKARETLINSNYAAVVNIAKKYVNEYNSIEDLVQDGLVGLLEATDKFDETQNVRFITYATPYINLEVDKAAKERSSAVTVSYKVDKRMRAAIASITEKGTRKINQDQLAEEIAERLGKPKYEISAILNAVYNTPAELDAPVPYKNEQKDLKLKDIVQDESAAEKMSGIENREMFDIMMRNMKLLTQQQRTVIQLRFGFQDGIQRSYDEIGTELRCNRQWINIVIRDALRTLQLSLSESITELQKDWLNRLIEDSRSTDIDFY